MSAMMLGGQFRGDGGLAWREHATQSRASVGLSAGHEQLIAFAQCVDVVAANEQSIGP